MVVKGVVVVGEDVVVVVGGVVVGGVVVGGVVVGGVVVGCVVVGGVVVGGVVVGGVVVGGVVVGGVVVVDGVVVVGGVVVVAPTGTFKSLCRSSMFCNVVRLMKKKINKEFQASSAQKHGKLKHSRHLKLVLSFIQNVSHISHFMIITIYNYDIRKILRRTGIH